MAPDRPVGRDHDEHGVAATYRVSNQSQRRSFLVRQVYRHLAENGALKYEDAYETIAGGATKEWENWHQTGRASVGLPGVFAHDPPYVGGHAGCPECVHAHWSWERRAAADPLITSHVAGNRVACRVATDGSGPISVIPTDFAARPDDALRLISRR